MEEFDRAQSQAMELLIQQCIRDENEYPSALPADPGPAAANATILDLLAQTCADANAAAQELSVAEVATALASAVSSTQKSLRSIGKNVNAIMQDPEQMHELCCHVKQADAKVFKAFQESQLLLEGPADSVNKAKQLAVSETADSMTFVVASDEETVRNMMGFAEKMCFTMDHALSTITQDELALAAQLSLTITQKLLHAGQSLFTSLGDEERRKARRSHITVEEIEEELEELDQDKQKLVENKGQMKRAAVLRMYVEDLYYQTRAKAVDHPFVAGILTAAGLPFIGLAIPLASLVALALLIEKYYPEHAKLTVELCSNFIQMSKLWFLLLKISARQVSVVTKECFKSWYEYASTHGFIATGFEMASTGCSIGYFGLSYLYQAALNVSKQLYFQRIKALFLRNSFRISSIAYKCDRLSAAIRVFHYCVRFVGMESRERLQIDTEVPSNVFSLNLHKLSELAHISEAELVRGMQSDDAVNMQGVVVNCGQEVPFEAVGKSPEDEDDTFKPSYNGTPLSEKLTDVGVKQVLLTAASSTMCLDGSDTPKCLIQLGEYTLMEHILAQLFVAGIERVVIIISYFGREIIDHVKSSFLYAKLQIDFLNLGEETSYGHARTVLSAREMFTQPFLIHTADHIFDHALISRMAHFELDECVACVLVDSNTLKHKDLPFTAGKVLLDFSNNTIRKIGRHLKHFDAIDAGLFLTTQKLFAALEMLAYEKPKFSLAEALNVLRPSYGLKYLETAEDAWLSIETQAQFDAILANDTIVSLSPWPVFVAKEPLSTRRGGKNVFLAVSAADDDSILRAIGVHIRPLADVFEGFVVGVNQLQEVNDTSSFTSVNAHETTPLLENSHHQSPSRRSVCRLSNKGFSIRRKKSSFLAQTDDSFVLSIPLDQSPHSMLPSSDRKETGLSGQERQAYLIELPHVRTSTASSSPSNELSPQLMLAVPDSGALYKRPTFLRRFMSLPTDICNISVETVELRNNTMALQLLVTRQVPLIGYVLLVAALVSISYMGTALNLQQNVNPFIQLFWRTTASLLVLLPLAAIAVYHDGLPHFSTQMLLRCSICALSYAVYVMTFLWSVSHTSIDHAYIFNNCHALLLVSSRLVLGRYVSQFEGLGTAIGVIGGAITTLDHSQLSLTRELKTFEKQVSLSGDLVALLGAIGGAVYLVTAKRLRFEINLFLFLVGLFAILALLLSFVLYVLAIPFQVSRDPMLGLFGWTDASQVTLEAHVVFVCTLMGTLGYVAVLKYFTPIVVAVVCLVEPVLIAFMGVAVDGKEIPSLLTLCGSLLIISGTALVVISHSSKIQTIDATPAMTSTLTILPRELAAGFKLPQQS
ncbi:uncharacterized protein CCR75_009440 [Bremia lactucae]|uniref:Uncharacterized protein n=1 Tax=Bremia lactucae TaxID=4779 RepID=A0A976IM64_BRELC|nr:hypothetical protein CCR75_009440 [Bremia lactucae]